MDLFIPEPSPLPGEHYSQIALALIQLSFIHDKPSAVQPSTRYYTDGSAVGQGKRLPQDLPSGYASVHTDGQWWD